MDRRSFLYHSSLVTGSAALSLQRSYAAMASGPVVEIATGKIRGSAVDGVYDFKGIPYGASTAGVNRFMPPKKPSSWNGVRDAIDWGTECVQVRTPTAVAADGTLPMVAEVYGTGGLDAPKPALSEDCLYLNVWTPGLKDGKKRPVMVWFHGGGFAQGGSAALIYQGSSLCKKGDVVLVTVNHRLNVFGYTHLGDIGDGAYATSGNAGVLDLVQSLEWVRDNIAALGGDPGNVTIFGEFGGGGKVSCLLGMPAAKGLFHRAIIQSGASLRFRTRDEATKTTKDLLNKLGTGTTDLKRLQDLPADQLLEAAVASGAANARPVVDGASLPNHPFDPVATEISATVPIMVGITKDEATLFLAADPKFGSFTDADLAVRVKGVAKDKADDAIKLYKKLYPNDLPTYLIADIQTQSGAWMNSVTLAERKFAQGKAPVYMYVMARESTFRNGILRANHGADLAYTFDRIDAAPNITGKSAASRALGDQMSRAWTAFARSGNPDHAGLPHWPAYDPATRATIFLDATSKIVNDPWKEQRQFWQSLRSA